MYIIIQCVFLFQDISVGLCSVDEKKSFVLEVHVFIIISGQYMDGEFGVSSGEMDDSLQGQFTFFPVS